MATIPPVWLARSARVAKVSSSIGVILVAGVAMEIERRAHEPLTRYMHAAVCVFLRNTHLLAVGEQPTHHLELGRCESREAVDPHPRTAHQ